MIDISGFLFPASMNLGPRAPKAICIEGNQMEAGMTLAHDADGRVEIGVWECTQGRFSADRTTSAEDCHYVPGEVEMTHADGRKQALGPGDARNLALGWKGEWRVIEIVRMLCVTTHA